MADKRITLQDIYTVESGDGKPYRLVGMFHVPDNMLPALERYLRRPPRWQRWVMRRAWGRAVLRAMGKPTAEIAPSVSMRCVGIDAGRPVMQIGGDDDG